MKKEDDFYGQCIVIDGLGASVIDEEYARRMVNSGLTAINMTLGANEHFKESAKLIANWDRKIERLSQYLFHITKYSDIEKAKSINKVGIIYGFQNTNPVENDISLVNLLHRMGVHILQLTYNERNLSGDGCSERTDAGLSDFGIELIHEINRVGILLDLSHAGTETTLEAINVSQKPIVISHSNVRELCDTPRNVSSDVLKALAQKDGVIGINAFPGCVSMNEKQTIEDYLNHIDYVVEAIGVDHVGIGLDLIEGYTKEDYTIETGEIGYDNRPYKASVYPPWPWIYPKGIARVDDLPNIATGLFKRDYKEADIAKIVGGNFLRVFKETWQ